ncbi:hypothetical protein L208DRAFT_706982 [Tricholoma matsutake]|nr:hypothetical protein L208DRAFT_706982 [Tricholoma matsutake 945]
MICTFFCFFLPFLGFSSSPFLFFPFSTLFSVVFSSDFFFFLAFAASSSTVETAHLRPAWVIVAVEVGGEAALLWLLWVLEVKERVEGISAVRVLGCGAGSKGGHGGGCSGTVGRINAMSPQYCYCFNNITYLIIDLI